MACADCISGALHTGTPTGTEQTIHDLPTYVAAAPSGSPRAILVFIPDAFGWTLPNARILADAYARALDATVYLPDFMQGNAIPADVLGSMHTASDASAGWVARATSALRCAVAFPMFLIPTREAVSGPIVFGFFRAVRAATALPVGAAGFCWGGRWALGLGRGEDGGGGADQGRGLLVDAAFTAHPSAWGLKIPEDIDAIGMPFSIAIGTVDHFLKMPQVREIEAVFKDKPGCEIIAYDGAVHGFAIRSEPNDEKAVRHGVEAQEQAVRFFRKHLLGGKE